MLSKKIKDPLFKKTLEKLEEVLGPDMEEFTVERAVVGIFFSGVKLSNGSGGLCFTPIKEIPEAVCCPSSIEAMPLSGKMAGKPIGYYLESLDSKHPMKRMMALCVLNALSSSCWEKEKPTDYTIEYGVDAFDAVDIPVKGKIVVVGALVPMLRKLLKEEAPFVVLEQDPSTLKGKELDHYQDAKEADKCVPDADLLVITGVTVLNNTLKGLMELAKKGAEVVVTGPTVSMVPDAFFDLGVTVMGGVVVTKVDELLDIISKVAQAIISLVDMPKE